MTDSAKAEAEVGVRETLEALLSTVDVYVPDDGLLKGKMVLAIGYESAKHCWTPQNSYEHAVINTLGGAIKRARAALIIPAKAEAEVGMRKALEAIIQMDDDAMAAHGKPYANLNGYGLVDLFDCVGHPFGSGEHKQQPCRSNNLEAALSAARAALANLPEKTQSGCICQDQHRRGYCTEPGCPYAKTERAAVVEDK